MCGRYTNLLSWQQIHRLYNLTAMPQAVDNAPPRYNIGPTQMAPIVVEVKGERRAGLARWGLIPPWVQSLAEIRISTFNARADRLADSRLYAPSLQSRRCLVPASGWYEWRTESGRKTPFYVSPAEGEALTFAGLWSIWRDAAGEKITSFSIVTLEAAPELSVIHERMPAVLPPEAWADWLAGSPESALTRLKPSASGLAWWPVGPAVGNIRNDGPELTARIDGD